MQCDVSLGDYEGEPARVFHSEWRTARKPHRCFECRETIPSGAQYEHVSGLWDKWESYKFCTPCSEISKEFSDGGRSFGMVWEGMEENWEEGAHIIACINRLTSVASKRKLHERWLQWKVLA